MRWVPVSLRRAALHANEGASLWPEGDGTAPHAHGRSLRQRQLAVREDGAEDDLHLVEREGGANTATNAAPKGQPRGRVGLALEKAVWLEGPGVGVDLRVPLRQVDAGRD